MKNKTYKMRLWLVILHILLVGCSVLLTKAYEDVALEDDEFAEFEQLDVDDDITDNAGFHSVDSKSQKRKDQLDPYDSLDIEDEITVEDEDSEFEHFQDPEEFEGLDSGPKSSQDQQKITIAKVPMTIPARWDAYWMEMLLCAGLVVYAANFLMGRNKNHSIAEALLRLHKPFLEENFSLVGEPANDSSEVAGEWKREAEHTFTIWCSGRTCCEGMLLTLKLIRRQDLLSILAGIFRPKPDTLQMMVEIGNDEKWKFVMCAAQKKIATRLAKEMADLSVFCPERRAGERHGLPSTFSVMSEIADPTELLLDERVQAICHKYHKLLQYIHISDQYSGPKDTDVDPSVTKAPGTSRVLVVCMQLPNSGSLQEDCESARPMLQLTFYLMEKLKRLRITPNALNKAEQNRQRVESEFIRSTHSARQEQAAAKREERRLQEKERVMAENDPEKQRRWELKEQKRQEKRKNPKMKQLKVKAL